MTLKEAIERYTSNAEYERIHGSLQGCLDFRQLAEWLKDYERLLEQEPKWIPVSERLPEERENPITMDYYQYPVTFQNGSVTDIRYYKFGDGHWWHGSQKMDEYVIAWQPLPKPYNPQERSNKE
jgi:hypothetical protein